MTCRKCEPEPVKPPPSEKLRIAAAQLRVMSDRKVRRKTPQWIVDLAKSGPNYLN